MTIFRLRFDDVVLASKTLTLTASNGYGVLDYECGAEEDALTLALLGTSTTQNLSLLGDLEWVAERVRDYNKNSGFARVYLERDVSDSGTDYYRTPIDDLQIELDRDFYRDLNGRKPEVTLKVKHPAYWESGEVGLKMYNPHVAGDTASPIRVDNLTSNQGGTLGNFYSYLTYNYAAHTNDFSSHLPYPLKIELTSQDSNAIDAVILTVGNQMNSGDKNQRVFDAKDGAGGTQKPGTADYNNYQYGYYKELNVSTSWSSVISWTISDLRMFEYDPLLVLARVLNPSANVRLGVRIGKGSAVFSEWRQTEAESVELIKTGILRTTALDLSTKYDTTYNLSLLAIAGTNTTLELDYLEIFPAQDLVEVFSASGRGLANGEKLIIDGAERRAYVQDGTGKVIDHWVIRGGGSFTCLPGTGAVIYIKMRGAGHVLKRVNAQVFARARTRA
jgi:hypothetical protein